MPFVFEDTPKSRYVFEDESTLKPPKPEVIKTISETESKQGRISHPALAKPETVRPTPVLAKESGRGIRVRNTIEAKEFMGQGDIERDPWADPGTVAEVALTMGTGAAIKQGIKYGVKEGVKLLGKRAIGAGVSAVADIPLGMTTELVAKDHPYLAYPFNVLIGIFSNVVPESIITGKILKAISGKKINPDIFNATVKKVQSALDAGQMDEADRIINNLATTDKLPLKATVDVTNIPAPDHMKLKAGFTGIRKEVEIPKIMPDEKINAITLEDAGKKIAKGDPDVIHHIQEGVVEKGKMPMEDAIRNQEMMEILKAKKGPEREAVKAHIQEIQPEIDKALRGEVKEPITLTSIIKAGRKEITEDELSRLPDITSGQRSIDDMRAYLETKGIKIKVEPIAKVEKIKIVKDVMKFTPSQRQTLQQAIKDISSGELVKNQGLKDPEGYFTGETLQGASMYPEYFKGKGYTAKEVLGVLKKALNGQALTKKQQVIVEDINQGIREEWAGQLKEQRATKEISAWDLQEGDKLKRHGEIYTVKNVDDTEFEPKVTIKNSETLTLKGNESIKYDRGTLKKGDVPVSPDFIKTDIKGEEQAIWRGKGFDAEFPAGKKITPEEMRGRPKPKIEGQEDIFAPTPKETEKQQGLFAGTTADLGGYAPPRGTIRSQYKPPKGLFALEMPEIVELAKAISGGKYPQVKAKLSHRLAAGLFRTSTGNIELKADIFKNPDEAQKVLSHEIGHLVDWLPDNDISRGNILGRIASLKKYMSRLLAEYPDSPNKVLIPQDRARIRKEAERLAKGTAKTTIEVEEQIIKELPLKSDDILKIMNDVGGEIRATDKKLYEWFAGLSGGEKKSILKEALKGRIPDWVSFKKTVIEGVRIVKKTIYETIDPRKKYHDMIIAEIKKRRLYQYETIMDELKALSKEWKPFDEAKVHPKYIKYRYSSKELYADSISVLFNDPALLKQKAPTYYKAFFAYLEKKPEVSAIYEEIQNRLKLGYEDIFRQRDINVESMFKRGEAAYAEALKKPPLQVWKSIKKSMVDVNTEAIHKVKEAEKMGIKIPSELNPRYWIEELPYMSGPVKQYYADIENLVRNTASDVEIGKYMFAGRVRTERATLANPLGTQQKNAIDYIEYLKAKDPERHAKIEEAIRQFRTLRATQIVPEIESAEMFDDVKTKLLRDNEHYATFDIVKYIEKRFGRNISSHIHKQVGTLEDTANPFTATIMKDTALLRTAHVTKTKKAMVSFLQQAFPGDIAPADTIWNGRYHEVVDPKDPNKGLIAFLHKGEVKGFYVDKEIADTFYKDPYKGGVILKTWMAMSQPLKDLLVSKNPWFMLWNIQRDLRSSAKQLPGASIPKMIWYGIKSAPDAYKDVIKDIHSLDVSEMYKGKMLITGRAYGKDVSPDSQLERMMQEFLIKPQEYNNQVIAPLKKFWDFMDKPGQFSERLFKIAGYKYLKANTDLPDKQIAHLVRTRAGSPDFMRGGQHRLIYNNVFLFSNAGKEGWRSSIEAYKENPARYIWKTIEYDILPKVAMFAATGGLFGDDIKRWFEKVPERDKANYQIVPIGETSDGKAIYFRIPHDFTGQAVAGLTWKAMNQYKDINLQDVLDYSAGGLPYTGLHPFIGLTVDTYQYMTGKNPYNAFTGRYVIPEQVFEAGGIRAAEEFGKHAANQLGVGIIYKFKGADLRQTSSELEKLLGYPIVGRGIERFLKVSDYGLTEEIKRTVEPVRQERAQENIAISDRIIEDVKSKEEISENDIKQLYIQLHNEGILTRKEYSDFRDTYKLMAIRKVGDPYIKAYMAAKSNEEKMAILNMIMKEKETK